MKQYLINSIEVANDEQLNEIVKALEGLIDNQTYTDYMYSKK